MKTEKTLMEMVDVVIIAAKESHELASEIMAFLQVNRVAMSAFMPDGVLHQYGAQVDKWQVRLEAIKGTA